MIFFLAFSLFKMCESVKVWKWSDFFTFFYFFSRKICKHHNSHRNFAAQFRKAPERPRSLLSPRWGGIEEQLRRSRGNDKAPNVTQHPLNLNLIPNAKKSSMNLKTVLNGIQMVHEKILRDALRKTLWLVLNLSMWMRIRGWVCRLGSRWCIAGRWCASRHLSLRWMGWWDPRHDKHYCG